MSERNCKIVNNVTVRKQKCGLSEHEIQVEKTTL